MKMYNILSHLTAWQYDRLKSNLLVKSMRDGRCGRINDAVSFTRAAYIDIGAEF